MAQTLTVLQLRNRLQKLVDSGHGHTPVLTGNRGVQTPKVVNKEATYIGPSMWDSDTFRFGPDGSGSTVVL